MRVRSQSKGTLVGFSLPEPETQPARILNELLHDLQLGETARTRKPLYYLCASDVCACDHPSGRGLHSHRALLFLNRMSVCGHTPSASFADCPANRSMATMHRISGNVHEKGQPMLRALSARYGHEHALERSTECETEKSSRNLSIQCQRRTECYVL